MFNKTRMPTKDSALPGREERMPVPGTHFVNGAPLQAPFPDGAQVAAACDERHVVAGSRQPCAVISADCAGTQNGEPHHTFRQCQ